MRADNSFRNEVPCKIKDKDGDHSLQNGVQQKEWGGGGARVSRAATEMKGRLCSPGARCMR